MRAPFPPPFFRPSNRRSGVAQGRRGGGLRATLVALLALVSLSACPLGAPAPVSGLASGERCTADLDCAAGLACECGECAQPGDVDEPVSCTVDPDGACPETPSDCYSTCGDDTSVVGSAECRFGRETCSTGQTFEECGPSVCWDTPQPGEVCLSGEFVCELGRSQETGLCYTNNCLGPPGDCVNNCNEGFVFDEECLGGSYQCEFGVAIAECGNCLGDAPGCVLSCLDPPVATAFCTAGEWDCSFVVGAITDEECGPVDAGHPDGGLIDGGLDGGPNDGGLDGGSNDGGLNDGGPNDGGVDGGNADAGAPDGGPADAGAPDAGAPDAGVPDAGPAVPTALAFAEPIPTTSVDVCSPAIAFDVVDAQGQPVNVAGVTVVSVTEEEATADIFSDAECSIAAEFFVVQPGASRAQFYLQGSAPLGVSVLLQEAGLVSATGVVTITP